ncbi:hypothetical protein ARMGADRAFT_1089852 [Armillaria gallica]|uniref:Uncharacterized protein n=1 Tax=Armillaria gallica TaxID=47427 RepID=A0A2H3D3P7_ARMGA|nr:hypothetical protein ARMGADRAFT_1089852 [Armillaria gallica]
MSPHSSASLSGSFFSAVDQLLPSTLAYSQHPDTHYTVQGSVTPLKWKTDGKQSATTKRSKPSPVLTVQDSTTPILSPSGADIITPTTMPLCTLTSANPPPPAFQPVTPLSYVTNTPQPWTPETPLVDGHSQQTSSPIQP